MKQSGQYRELQFKSSQLAAVFVGVLIVGVIIFILGVSVGKKQGRLAAEAGLSAAAKSEAVIPDKPLPRRESAEPGRAEPEGQPGAVKTPADEVRPPEKKAAAEPKKAEAKPAAAPAKTGRFFVQASATNDKAAATSFARRLERDGFTAVVLDPFPTDVRTFYRVRIGPYPGREEAEAARKKLAAVLGKRPADFFLVRF
ncbi:MAG: SPOR domain-containing protein [Candidatus Aminicenantes bacterium]|nr:SPOR domain-containing protein [Candidatus Aminicenantes bacterium]